MVCPVSLSLPCGDALVAAAMVASLVAGTAVALFRLLVDLPVALLAAARTAAGGGRPPAPDPPSAVRYYTGTVRHTRHKPAKHAFRYRKKRRREGTMNVFFFSLSRRERRAPPGLTHLPFLCALLSLSSLQLLCPHRPRQPGRPARLVGPLRRGGRPPHRGRGAGGGGGGGGG